MADNAEAPDVLSGMLNNGALGLRVLLSSALGNSSRSLLQGAIPVVMNHGAPLYVHTELLSSIDTKVRVLLLIRICLFGWIGN